MKMMVLPEAKGILAGCVSLVLLGSAWAAPPREMLLRLTAEEYPEREAAGRELFEWAAGHGDEAKAWLAEHALGAEDAELQERSLEVLRQLVLSELAKDRPGFVGINMRAVPVETSGEEVFGIAVLEVVEGSPAEKAGIKAGQIILKLDGRGWKEGDANDDFVSRIGSKRGGDAVTLTVLRSMDAGTEEVELTLVPRPWKNGTYQREAAIGGFNSRSFSTEAEAKREVFREWFESFCREQRGR